MADYTYGGSEEENAELKKLEVDLVRVTNLVLVIPKHSAPSNTIRDRPMTPITSRPGKSWFAPERRSKVASTAIPTLKPSQPYEACTIDSSPSSRCSLDIGRNMRIWNSLSREPRQQIW